MIVPTHRLMLWLLCVVVPAGLITAAAPALALAAWSLVLLLIAAALVDATLGLGRLRGIAACLPDLVRLTRDREGSIMVVVMNPGKQAMEIRLGLPFPEYVASEQDDVVIQLPDGHEQVTYEWICTGVRRGCYQMDRCYFERISPLKLWALRNSTEANTQIRVYPNLMRERRSLAALFLNSTSLGIHAQRLVGKGRDFEKLREYIPGDSYEDIHWKASAKRGHPVTKVYQVERTQEVYVIIDASRLSARRANPLDPDDQESQLERFLTAALVVGMAAEKQGDNFGLMLFSDHVEKFVRARNGRTHYGACRDAIYTAEPRLVAPDFEEMATFIRTRLTRRALLVFLTSLDDPVLSESFVHNIQLLGRQHLIMTNMLVSPGVRPLFSAPDAARLEDVYRQLGGHYRWQDLQEVERVLQRRGVTFKLLNSESLCVDLVSQYIGVKQRQLI